jgi:hypothetical protein
MSAYKNVNGVWTKAQHIWTNVNGTWTKVKKGFVNVNGVWKQFHTENLSYEIYALGQVQKQTPDSNKGIWSNGALVVPAQRSYNVVTFNAAGAAVSFDSYDLFADQNNEEGLAAKMSGLAAGTFYMVYSYAEPNTHMDNDSGVGQGAMEPVFGGVTSILDNFDLPYAGAYLAIGVARQPPIFEGYCGTYVNSVSNPSATTPQADQGCADGALIYTVDFINGGFANLTQVYAGGNFVTNPHAVGTPVV